MFFVSDISDKNPKTRTKIREFRQKVETKVETEIKAKRAGDRPFCYFAPRHGLFAFDEYSVWKICEASFFESPSAIISFKIEITSF